MTDSYKLKIVKSGYDITEEDIANIVFDSDINTFKIRQTDIIELTPSDGTHTLNHNLGYSPASLIFFEVDGNGKWFPVETREDQSGKNVEMWAGTDDDDMLLTWFYDTEPTSLRCFYMLIVDPVN
jgi:hypothetical protein